MQHTLEPTWRERLASEFEKPYWSSLSTFVTRQRNEHPVFPPAADVFEAFRLTPWSQVKVLLLGQDPYHGEGQAHGLCFSVRAGVKIPPSLSNVYKELESDLGIPPADHGCLVSWARQGVLMLNAVLTVRAGEPNSHKGQGWERFTDRVIECLDARDEPIVFVLWGGYARKKKKRIDARRHAIVESAHPSPLSARSFFGSRPFSRINAHLVERGHSPIDWRLPSQADMRGS